MKKILEYLSYVSQVVTAVTEGAKVASNHWPTHNPFASGKGDAGVKEPETK
jgi:hypothetical protein